MREDEFIKAVEYRADLGSPDAASNVTIATLRTLSQRIPQSEAEAIAAQLPVTLAEHLTASAAHTAETFSVDEFIQRVTDYEHEFEHIDESDAEHHIRAVTGVLATAVTGGELADTRKQLPDEYRGLFGAVGGDGIE